MARARGCDLGAVLARALICWVIAEGAAVAQEAAEVTEDLGLSYVLARRTTSQGSMIETLLFAGQAIVTEIAVPAPDAGPSIGTMGGAAVAGGAVGNASAAQGDAATFPLGWKPGFSGTLLTGEIVDDYLVLHRTRASDPVSHEIFHEGHKVGLVTEVASPKGGGGRGVSRNSLRNSFAFESAGDRFVVHLTQPDGTRIHATTEHGRFSGQAVERLAATAMPPRSAAAKPSELLLERTKPSTVPSSDPQRMARPEYPEVRIMVEQPAPQIVAAPQETVPLPRPFPFPRLRPPAAPAAAQAAIPSPPGIYRNTLLPATVAPAIRPRPPVASESAPSALVRPVAPASRVAVPPVTANPAVTSANGPQRAAAPMARSLAPASTGAVPPITANSTAASVNAPPRATAPAVRPTEPTSAIAVQAARPAFPVTSVRPPRPAAATAGRPAAPESTGSASAAKPKSGDAAENARPPGTAATRIAPVDRPPRPFPSGTPNP